MYCMHCIHACTCVCVRRACCQHGTDGKVPKGREAPLRPMMMLWLAIDMFCKQVWSTSILHTTSRLSLVSLECPCVVQYKTCARAAYMEHRPWVLRAICGHGAFAHLHSPCAVYVWGNALLFFPVLSETRSGVFFFGLVSTS